MKDVEYTLVDSNYLSRRVAAPLRQGVVDALREAISRSEFQPGERLLESALCDRYEVSRTVIREALRQLESEGLISMVANRGPEVARLSLDDARSLYQVRAALESLAGQLFATNATLKQRERLAEVAKDVEAGIASPSVPDRLAVKDSYYEALLDGAGNKEIQRMLRTLHARIQILRNYSLSAPGRGESTVAEIKRITEFAIAGDSEATRLACIEHVENAADVALAEMQRRASA